MHELVAAAGLMAWDFFEVCARWINDPYFQYFCGETFLRHDPATDRSLMARWRDWKAESLRNQARVLSSADWSFAGDINSVRHSWHPAPAT